MKLEVGMYVRTKWGYICELININEFREPNFKYGVEANYLRDIMFIGDEDILKASHTLLGNDEEPCLIEEGDYVNGNEVMEADWLNDDGEYEEGLAFPMYASNDLDVIENWLPLKNVPIKSIVTKEMFSSVEYRVEIN